MELKTIQLRSRRGQSLNKHARVIAGLGVAVALLAGLQAAPALAVQVGATPTATSTPKPTPTATPKPTSTPTPTATPVDVPAQALSKFRADLVVKKKAADIAKFDAMTAAQKNTLADYLLGKSVSFEKIPAGAKKVGPNAYEYNGFRWERPATQAVAARSSAAKSSGDSTIDVWSTQWFAFLGIKVIEVRNTMTYTTTFDSSKGVYINRIATQGCSVSLNVDVFASVTSTTNGAFNRDDWTAESDCFVTVKRGVPTPWGTISWDTKEAIHYMYADNTGEVTEIGWK